MPKVATYSDKNYQKKKSMYDAIAQCIEDIKYDETNGVGWNRAIEEMKGVTCRLIGREHLELTYHRFVMSTVEDLARMEDDGKKFLKEVEKELKKRFKKLTSKELKMKIIKTDRGYDKYSRMQADNSWMVGSSRYGGGQHPIARYLIKDSQVYSFSAKLEE